MPKLANVFSFLFSLFSSRSVFFGSFWFESMFKKIDRVEGGYDNMCSNFYTTILIMIKHCITVQGLSYGINTWVDMTMNCKCGPWLRACLLHVNAT